MRSFPVFLGGKGARSSLASMQSVLLSFYKASIRTHPEIWTRKLSQKDSGFVSMAKYFVLAFACICSCS